MDVLAPRQHATVWRWLGRKSPEVVEGLCGLTAEEPEIPIAVSPTYGAVPSTGYVGCRRDAKSAVHS